MKRVYCLYRVSTKKQVDKDGNNQNDIPMQIKACHDFAGWQDEWVILKEYAEYGVSGYKVSAQDRDAIQDLQAAAENHEFDILLVFMFDRIGRIDDETPFVVEWFVKHGIEVWSTQEGQQRFETHVDKLMNYIRFWQASGESEKCSIRISNKMQQMILDGFYIGGPVRFGYKLVDSGQVNRKGLPIKKYEIDPVEREVVEMIDDMTVRKGYGSYRLASFLNEHGYRTRTGGKFTSIKIIRILKDPYYCGRTPEGATSPGLEALRIRSDDTFMQILEILEQRSGANEEKLEELFKKKVAGNRAKQKKLSFELGKSQTQLEKLQVEIANSLTGDSVYSAKDLSQAISTIKAKVRELNDQLAKLKEEEMKEKQGKDMVSPAYRQFKSWAEEYDEATLEQKKMIFCGLFNRIEVGRDYKISVELNMSYRQFCSEWSNDGDLDGMIAI